MKKNDVKSNFYNQNIYSKCYICNMLDSNNDSPLRERRKYTEIENKLIFNSGIKDVENILENSSFISNDKLSQIKSFLLRYRNEDLTELIMRFPYEYFYNRLVNIEIHEDERILISDILLICLRYDVFPMEKFCVIEFINYLINSLSLVNIRCNKFALLFLNVFLRHNNELCELYMRSSLYDFIQRSNAGKYELKLIQTILTCGYSLTDDCISDLTYQMINILKNDANSCLKLFCDFILNYDVHTDCCDDLLPIFRKCMDIESCKSCLLVFKRIIKDSQFFINIIKEKIRQINLSSFIANNKKAKNDIVDFYILLMDILIEINETIQPNFIISFINILKSNRTNNTKLFETKFVTFLLNMSDEILIASEGVDLLCKYLCYEDLTYKICVKLISVINSSTELRKLDIISCVEPYRQYLEDSSQSCNFGLSNISMQILDILDKI